MTPVAKLLDALAAHGCKPKARGKGWVALCPAHPDRQPSLSVDESKDGKVLLKCFAGCSCQAIVAAVGLKVADLFPGRGRGKGG